MSAKKKNLQNLKRQGDPLDDILKQNLYLTKYAKSNDQPHLVQEILYEKILPTMDRDNFATSTEFSFNILPLHNYFTSFPTEFQLVADATILLTTKTGDSNPVIEALSPSRHKMSLPLNGLNMFFQDCSTAFNFHTKLDSDRNYFLDFDGWDHMSALDQNFNPSPSNIKLRENLGYTRLLSGDMENLPTIMKEKQKHFHPEEDSTAPFTAVDQIKRYYMSLPFYPFRTICPRDVAMYPKMSSTNFNYSSPIFPANTQINFVLQRRKNTNFIDFMLPFNLNSQLGHASNELTAAQRTVATTFSVGTGALKVEHVISKVEIKLNSLYLQVIRLKYKGISPERPLSNVFTSYRTIFTPLQKVSLHQYDLGWESSARPIAVYIGFVKESDVQYLDTNKVFHTPGIYYRPTQLKSMQAILGNTESKTIYHNFFLDNLNTNTMDYTHLNYEKYLQNNFFIPLGENNYFEHTKNSLVPSVPSTELGKGLFNIFPLSLDSEILNQKNTPTSSLGIISSSPLKLEIKFEPVPTITWFMFYTFCYLNKINFTGSKTKQDVTIEYLT